MCVCEISNKTETQLRCIYFIVKFPPAMPSHSKYLQYLVFEAWPSQALNAMERYCQGYLKNFSFLTHQIFSF